MTSIFTTPEGIKKSTIDFTSILGQGVPPLSQELEAMIMTNFRVYDAKENGLICQDEPENLREYPYLRYNNFEAEKPIGKHTADGKIMIGDVEYVRLQSKTLHGYIVNVLAYVTHEDMVRVLPKAVLDAAQKNRIYISRRGSGIDLTREGEVYNVFGKNIRIDSFSVHVRSTTVLVPKSLVGHPDLAPFLTLTIGSAN